MFYLQKIGILAGAIAWAAVNGITTGVAEGVFGTYEPCTRAHLATFLYRACGESSLQSAGASHTREAPAFLKHLSLRDGRLISFQKK